MHVVLFDSRHNDAQKDFAGGLGVGLFRGDRGIRSRLLRWLYQRDYRPNALTFAYLAAIFQKLGHRVEYAEETLPPADLYLFNPSLLTLEYEKHKMQALAARHPDVPILVVGSTANALGESLQGTNRKIVQGEPEQLYWHLDEVMESRESLIDLGVVADLDQLPHPDWSPFPYRRFQIKYDFWRFPTTLLQMSRGCTFTCNYCPYIALENKTRFRSAEAVVEEIDRGYRHFGFRSFKFRDPLFGLNRKRVLELADGILRLKHKIQFSVETRIDLMREETLSMLRQAGLTSITVGIETPDEGTLRRHRRTPISDDRQQAFIGRCRALGIRTVAGFMVGFPHDTEETIQRVLDYARQINPTYANFNIVTPYPGTPFFESVRNQIRTDDYSQYSVYQPVMKYEYLTPKRVAELHTRCFTKYYFRSRYLLDNGRLLWPRLGRVLPATATRQAA